MNSQEWTGLAVSLSCVFFWALLQATCASNGPQTIFDVILLQWLPVRFCGAGAIYGAGSAGRGTPFICKWN